MMQEKKTRKVKRTAGAEMLEGLRAFRDALRRGEKIEGRFTVRTLELDPERLLPNEYNSEAVRTTRDRLGVSQPIFAQLLGVSLKLIQSWEQGTRKPEMLARHVLDDINRNPAEWFQRLGAAQTPARKLKSRVPA
jgi:DNA-binding transcriptional regulator YiaG